MLWGGTLKVLELHKTVSSFQVADLPLDLAPQRFKGLTSEKLHTGLALHP